MGAHCPLPFQPNSKIIKIDNISQQLSQCQQILTTQCPAYGTLHRVSYKGVEFSIGESTSNLTPESYSIHYMVHPNLLIVPSHGMLQNVKLSEVEIVKDLALLMKSISTLAAQHQVGLGRNRVGFSSWTKNWGTVGENFSPLWNYQKILKQQSIEGIYLSPQLMKAYSQEKIYPKIDVHQSDVFILAIMLLEIIFSEDLQTQIYDYQASQIRLKPILDKMALLQENFPKKIYEIFIRMLEFSPDDRISFSEIIQELRTLSINPFISSPIQPSKNAKTEDFTPPAVSKKINLSPSRHERVSFQRGRSPGVIRKNIPNTQRQSERLSLSPYRNSYGPKQRRSSRILGQIEEERNNTSLLKITPNRHKIWQGMQNNRPAVEPFGLKGKTKKEEPKQKTSLIQRLRS